MNRSLRVLLPLFLLTLCVMLSSALADPARHRQEAVTSSSDSTYDSYHPCLLFTPSEIPALQAKIQDGGRDDTAYDFIKLFVDYIYPSSSYSQLLGDDFGLGTIPNLGLVTHLESPQDSAACDLGKNLTLYIAGNWDVDFDVYYSSLRLRALALGYDMFFHNSNTAERESIKNEIVSYIDTMLANTNYKVYRYRPYLSNKSVMMASSLGLAAICLKGEIDSSTVQNSLETADQIINSWLYYLLDLQGSYNEGTLYGSWSMRMLVYYFYARKRYDGYDYASIPKIRNMEKWLSYELLPEGSSRVNNLNDCNYSDWPLSKNNTYFEWAENEWESQLSAWIWDHTSGDYGYDYGIKADKAATVLWHQELTPAQPDSVLPKSFLWENRGLYYFRSGWQSGASSNDVMFSFYSGKFQGGHAQEDQNNFTLYGYGSKFAIDNGIGSTAKQSEAHNMVFIDGKGQHNAGSSIGTDGNISRFLLSGFADYIQGDATKAYTTHSSLNDPDFPLPGTDWSWGYEGGNPVNFAYRNFIVVHDDETPPYFLLFDDIEKDGGVHEYQWRMHIYESYGIDTTQNPVRISNGASFMDIYVLNPGFGSLAKGIEYFNNLNEDPNSNIISFATNDINPRFTLLLVPGDDTTPQPVFTKQAFPWGVACTINWGSGKSDILLVNYTGGEILFAPGDTLSRTFPLQKNIRIETASLGTQILTDASTALLRTDNGLLRKYLLSNATICVFNDTAYVSIANGPANVALSGSVINIDRYDADFTFYAPGVDAIYYRGQRIYATENNGYLTPDPTTDVTPGQARTAVLDASAYPNPFNPSTTLRIRLHKSSQVSITIFDALGRVTKKLCDKYFNAGAYSLRWDGKNESNKTVASGVYFARISASGTQRVIKLILLK